MAWYQREIHSKKKTLANIEHIKFERHIAHQPHSSMLFAFICVSAVLCVWRWCPFRTRIPKPFILWNWLFADKMIKRRWKINSSCAFQLLKHKSRGKNTCKNIWNTNECRVNEWQGWSENKNNQTTSKVCGLFHFEMDVFKSFCCWPWNSF